MNININEIGSFSQLFAHVIFAAMEYREVSTEGLLEKLHAYFEKKFESAERGCYAANVTYKRFTEDRLDVRTVSDILQALDLRLGFGLQSTAPAGGGQDQEEAPIVTSYPAIWDQKIDYLQLPVRVENSLKYGADPEIEYIGQLVSRTEEQLLKVVNFGKTALRQVNEAMVRHNLCLQTDTGNWKVPSPFNNGNYPQIWDRLIRTVPGMVGYPTGCLHNAGIHYIGQLVSLDSNELTKLVGIGESTSMAIRMAMRHLGVEFNTNTEGWKPPKQ